MRSLNPDEEALWARVTATIRPLSREPLAEPPKPASTSIPGAIQRRSPYAKTPKANPAQTTGRTLDSSWDRRLRSGTIEPDRVIDLHGHNLDRAWSAIDRGLERAIVQGERVVLLITGHARPGDRPVERGKIRAAVHHWLDASRHAGDIAAVRGAHGRHGGGGSLYIILRRKRFASTIS